MIQPSFETALPSAPLKDYVQFYFEQRYPGHPSATTFSYWQTTLPTGYTFLGFVFSRSIRFAVRDAEPFEVASPVFFAGQFDRLYRMQHPPGAQLFGAVLRAVTASRLLAGPIHELQNTAVDADAHIDRELLDVHDRMAELPFHSRVQHLEHWLLKKLTLADHPTVFSDHAARRILECQGVTTTRELAKSLKVSERHFQRSFKERIGLSPYRYATIVKVNHLVNTLNQTATRLEDLLDRYRYYDSAHFRRQFRSVAQTSLSSYLERQNDAAELFLKRANV